MRPNPIKLVEETHMHRENWKKFRAGMKVKILDDPFYERVEGVIEARGDYPQFNPVEYGGPCPMWTVNPGSFIISFLGLTEKVKIPYTRLEIIGED